MNDLLERVSVLVIDNDISVLHLLRKVLELEGMIVLTTSDGETALETFDRERPDLVLLDIMMPHVDGYTLFQRLREFSQVPIIIITAKRQDEEKVYCFNIGADDYITKPFSTDELVARIRAVMRRTNHWNQTLESAIYFNDLVIDFARHRINIGKQEVNLTVTEYRLLSYLARNAGRVVTSKQLLERIWGEEYGTENHLLQVNIARLRQKLGDRPRESKYIMTKPGIGYIMSK